MNTFWDEIQQDNVLPDEHLSFCCWDLCLTKTLFGLVEAAAASTFVFRQNRQRGNAHQILCYKKKYKVNFWLLYAVFATIFQKAFWVKFPEFEPKEHIFPTNFCNSFRFGCISQPCNKSRMGFYKSSLSKYTIFLLKFESLASCGAI